MAKVYKQREDKYSTTIISAVAVILILLLSIAAQYSGWQYYVWGLVVSYFWGEAMYGRQPTMYPNRASRAMIFMFNGAVLIVAVTIFTAIVRNPELLQQLLAPPTQ
ncbi:MAG: hypothetical protein N2D54_07895 [Chloroflexota bacterium]